jgi:hypothetical protein
MIQARVELCLYFMLLTVIMFQQKHLARRTVQLTVGIYTTREKDTPRNLEYWVRTNMYHVDLPDLQSRGSSSVHGILALVIVVQHTYSTASPQG